MLAGRSERPHKVAGSWPDGLRVARFCNSRAVRCLIHVYAVQEGQVTWGPAPRQGRSARRIRVESIPGSYLRDTGFKPGHRNGLFTVPPVKCLDAAYFLPRASPCSSFTIYCFIIVLSRVGVVGTATRYGLDGPGIESRWGRDFTHPSRPAGVRPASYEMSTGSLPGGRAAEAWR